MEMSFCFSSYLSAHFTSTFSSRIYFPVAFKRFVCGTAANGGSKRKQNENDGIRLLLANMTTKMIPPTKEGKNRATLRIHETSRNDSLTLLASSRSHLFFIFSVSVQTCIYFAPRCSTEYDCCRCRCRCRWRRIMNRQKRAQAHIEEFARFAKYSYRTALFENLNFHRIHFFHSRFYFFKRKNAMRYMKET